LHSPDPDDDYLIALAFSQNAMLVSGDGDLLDLVGGAPILAPGDLLDALGMRQ
jgi:predicted nucleic acid-binding protein